MNSQIKRKRASSASLFLIELVVAILYFTLAASVCITIFVKAHIQSEKAKELNHALFICSDAAEIIRTSDSIEEAAANLGNTYEYATGSAGTDPCEIQIYFNDDYQHTPPSDLAKQETIQLSQEDDLISVNIIFADSNGSEVYHLSFDHARKAAHE